MTVAIYARVSTEEQARHGYSLSEQVRECRQRVKSQQFDVIEYVDEGVSGEFLDRPALTKLRDDLREGIIHQVICLDPDRLSRKLMNQLIISEEIEKKAEIIFVNGEYQRTPEGMLFYQMRGAIAEFEKAKINERMSRGRKEKARQGKVLRDFQIYGYDYNKDKEQLVINEYEVQVVKIIFNLFTNSIDWIKGINGIAKYLTNQGIPTKRNASQWHRQVVRQILMNRIYIGEFYQNRWNTEGMLGNKYQKNENDKIRMKERPKEDWILIQCPSIISDEEFNHAQKLLEQSRRRWSGISKNKYLLSGLIRCSHCQNTMTGRKSKNWGTIVYEYTDIKNTAGAKHPGCGNRIRSEELETKIWETIRDWLNDPNEIRSAGEDQQESSLFEVAELNRIQQEIINIKKGKDRLLTLLMESEDVFIKDIRQKLMELEKKEKQLHEHRKKAEEVINGKKEDNQSRNILKEASQYFLNLSNDEITFEVKQELIRKVVREIWISKDKQVEIFMF